VGAGLGTTKRKDIRFAAPCAAAFLVIPAPRRRLFRAPDGVLYWNREGSNIQFLGTGEFRALPDEFEARLGLGAHQALDALKSRITVVFVVAATQFNNAASTA
jgi:hypothetical protein